MSPGAASPQVRSDPRGRPPLGADLRRVLALAGPVVLVQFGLMAMNLVATLVGHVSATDLAATALGSLYSLVLLLLAWGALMALDPIVAQAVGAGDGEAVALGLQRGLVLALGLAIVITLGSLPARAVLVALGQPAAVVPLAARYVWATIPGLLPFLVFIVLRQTLVAMGHTRAGMKLSASHSQKRCVSPTAALVWTFTRKPP